jgi:hypothetical protein
VADDVREALLDDAVGRHLDQLRDRAAGERTLRFTKPESAREDLHLPPYCTSSKILNIGMYIEMTTTPTMTPTAIIMMGSMIEVSDFSIVATSSS